MGICWCAAIRPIGTNGEPDTDSGRAFHKAGGDFRIFRYNESGGETNLTPGFTFDQTWTQQNPFSPNTLQGSGMASLLLGIPTTGSQTTPAATALQWFYGAGYVQDNWVMKRLTLNLGLRYDIETPYPTATIERHTSIQKLVVRQRRWIPMQSVVCNS